MSKKKTPEAGADETNARKSPSALQVLFRVSRRLNAEAIGRMRDTSKESGLRTAHTMLLPHIDAEGTRPSVLAGRLGVTKQAVGQLVDELVEMGFLERVRDPADARARLVRFSKRGRKSVSTGLDVLEAMEAELSEKIGDKRMIELRRALAALDALLAPSAE